jgi:hypothetical protein
MPAGVLTVKRPHLLLKVTAVVSALLLVATLVCYRAGAFSRFKHLMPATAGASAESDDDVMFSSSKSDLMIHPSIPAEGRTTDEKGQPAIMYSTKSAPIIQPDKVEKQDFPPAPTKLPSDPK